MLDGPESDLGAVFVCTATFRPAGACMPRAGDFIARQSGAAAPAPAREAASHFQGRSDRINRAPRHVLATFSLRLGQPSPQALDPGGARVHAAEAEANRIKRLRGTTVIFRAAPRA